MKIWTDLVCIVRFLNFVFDFVICVQRPGYEDVVTVSKCLLRLASRLATLAGRVARGC